MREPLWTPEDFANAALAELTPLSRATLAIETLVALGGGDGLHILSVARAAICARMQDLITQQVLEAGPGDADVIAMPRMRPGETRW